MGLCQRRYGRNKKISEVIKAPYRDTANMIILGYLIDNCEEEEITLETIEAERFGLPVLTFLEKNYIRNNLSMEPSDIAEKIGLLEGEVREVMRNE